MTKRVLLVDDDAAVREALGQTLGLAEFEAITAGSFVEAKDRICRDFDGVILSDIRMPGRDGFHLLDYAHEQDPEIPVILLTAEGDIPMAVRAMSRGAFGFLEKPCSSADLTAVLERALQMRAMVLENRRLKRQVETGDAASRLIFGVSSQAEALRQRIRAVARAGTDALVVGPPGSGISKVAEVMHLTGAVSKGPFIKRAGETLDMASLAAAWKESLGGSLFIDRIGALPADSQLALMDLLEAGEARLIGGSNDDLGGVLHDELYYRLEVGMVRIPSLAERPDDVPVLFRHYVAQASEQAGLTPPEITEDVLSTVIASEWPGNARALMSAAMRFALGLGEEPANQSGLGLAERLAQVERALLIEALRRAEGQARLAAEQLRLPRKTFYDKLAKYGLKPDDYR